MPSRLACHSPSGAVGFRLALDQPAQPFSDEMLYQPVYRVELVLSVEAEGGDEQQ
jgi:hypothetical protein